MRVSRECIACVMVYQSLTSLAESANERLADMQEQNEEHPRSKIALESEEYIIRTENDVLMMSHHEIRVL